MSDLKTLTNEFGLALRESEAAEKAADTLAKSYDERRNEYLRRFEEENAGLIAHKKLLDETAEQRREHAYKLRKQLEEAARQWGVEHPNEPKPEVGVELRRFIEINKDAYSNRATFEACLKHFPYLLQINMKALEQFISANAEREGVDAVWKNPSIADFLPIPLMIVARPYLSNDKIKAAAGALSVIELSPQGESMYADIDLDNDDERYLGAGTLRKLKAADLEPTVEVDAVLVTNAAAPEPVS